MATEEDRTGGMKAVDTSNSSSPQKISSDKLVTMATEEDRTGEMKAADTSNSSSPQKDKSSRLERYMKLAIFKGPCCLVYNSEEMELKINEPVLDEIALIDVPVSVVGVCGVYRSGKSYLMNKLFGERKGFSLGSSIMSHTRGIWVWCKPHPTVPDQVLILFDTEGLADAKKSDQQHDRKIFCLTMLMSSVLIYNIKGVIDNDALVQLSFITEVTKVLSVTGSTDNEKDEHSLRYIAPHFVFCLRDFFLELVDQDKLTPDQYMEACLQETTDQQHEDYNNTRRCISNFFPRRNCFTLAQPAMNQKLRNLEMVPEEELDGEFKKDMQKLVQFVHNSGAKLLDEITRKCWNGNTFMTFLRSYIDKLTKGDKMEYISTMQAVSMNQNEKLQDEVCQNFQAELDQLELPEPSKKKLSDRLMDIRDQLLRQFREDAYFYRKTEYEDKGREKMKHMMEDVINKNSSQVQKMCYDYLYTERKNMMETNKQKYENTQEYEKDFDVLLKKYHEKFENYDEEERILAFHKLICDTKDEVLEMKHQANMREFVKKIEQVRKSELEDAKRRQDEWKKEQAQKLKEQTDMYQQRMSDLREQENKAQLRSQEFLMQMATQHAEHQLKMQEYEMKRLEREEARSKEGCAIL